MAPVYGTPEWWRLHLLFEIEGGSARSGAVQALYQLAALVTTLAMALVGGALTGKHPMKNLSSQLTHGELTLKLSESSF